MRQAGGAFVVSICNNFCVSLFPGRDIIKSVHKIKIRSPNAGANQR